MAASVPGDDQKEVIFDWLCRIFGSFVGWLGKKR